MKAPLRGELWNQKGKSAAKRFFKKMTLEEHRRQPFSISIDKLMAYSEAFTASQGQKIVAKGCELRRVKYLYDVIEQAPAESEEKMVC